MDESTLADGDNTDEIIGAIRRIMSDDDETLGDTPSDTSIDKSSDTPSSTAFSKQARDRIFAALDRLSGGEDNPPTVLEALILERLEPLLQDWIDRNMPPLAERLMREEIRGLFEAARDEPVLANDPDGKIRT